MRLLERNGAGEFSLTKDLVGDDEIPRYAILSHTWREGEEVTLKDLMDGTGKSVPGYDKIRFCGEQAGRDGLQYLWVDTCCIDKSNNTELSEAINSMFRWYRNAAKCYVYLSDVSDVSGPAFTSDKFSRLPCESTFRNSRWFTRGWTLQELLAPGSVEFFSREGKRLGDKRSLEQQVHEITGIPIPALQGTSLQQFGVEERLSWAEDRQTTRKEDKAYSLLGMFDVYMPLIYGEGSDNAFKRLREEIGKDSKGLDNDLLHQLPLAVEAPFNSYAKQHSPSCLPNTRVELLREIYGWADRQDERCLFWLNGLAGTGKSTIARTVARRYFEQKRLGASFFFSRGGGDVSHAGKFVLSIAVQLANSVPTLPQYIRNAISERRDIANLSLHDQWRQLVLIPLSKLTDSVCPSSYILVIDALDECDDDNDIRVIVQLLAEARSLTTVRLRVFLTSRPEIPIRHGFYQMPDTEHQDFVLHSISHLIVDRDISTFLEHNFKIIRQECHLPIDWPGEQDITHLVLNASGLFIWAATACRFIHEGKKRGVIKNRLSSITQSRGSIIAPEKRLNKIYTTVLKHIVPPGFTDEEKEELYHTLRVTLGSVVVLLSPLSAYSLGKLLHLPKEDMDEILDDLHSILDIPEGSSRPLRLHHPSFRDFLLDRERCGDQNFWVDVKQAHQKLADSCIRLMDTSLKQDICSVGIPGVLVADVGDGQVERCLPPEVQYACLYWIEHLQKSDAPLYNNDLVHQFLKVHLLHWLEALSWMQRVSEGIHAIASLESIALPHNCACLSEFVHDAKRFALYNRPVMEQAPLQIYCSALVFAPVMSAVREQFTGHIPRWMRRLPEMENNWNALLQTLEGHSGFVSAVACSPDGKLLASASHDCTVRLWDAGSGAALQTLEGHSDSVFAVAFSPDGKLLASGSFDSTVKLRDASSGTVLRTLKGHSSPVYAMAFSPDSKLLASGSNDHTVKLWDAGSGVALETLKGHSEYVRAVAFSPDIKLLASALGGTVKLWDIGSGAALQVLEGHSDRVSVVAFSPDGKLLASGSDDRTIKLWDVGSRAALLTLEGHLEYIRAVAFSPDSKLLASGSSDRAIKLWDAGSGVALKTLEGHSSCVDAVGFSPDGKLLVSGSRDRTVKLWDASSGAAVQTLEGHLSPINAMAFSPDGKLLASSSGDYAVKLWDASSGVAPQMLEDHSSSIYSVAFSPDSKLLASASRDRTIKLWDTSSGAALKTLKGHSNFVNTITFSLDGKQLASASGDCMIKLWDASSGAALQTFKSQFDWVSALAFSPDSRQLASGLDNHLIKLWDPNSGTVLQILKGHSGWIRAVAFSPDGRRLASASDDETVKLWDVGSGAVLQTLETNTVFLTLSFSDDGTFLHTDSGPLYTTSLSSSTAVPLTTLHPFIFVEKQWIRRGTENIIWLPSEHRPSRVAVHGNTVSFGYRTGRVLFMEFAF